MSYIHLKRPVLRPFCLLAMLGFLLFSAFPTQAHPQDEDIVLDIEMGELSLQQETLDEEYLAALKRKRLRKLAAMSWQQKVWLYVQSGFAHIIPKGLDHILFVLGLFLASLTMANLLWQISAFTLAHSITLALAALNVVVIPGSVVEPLIALSIVWVGVENCFVKKPGKWRVGVVFAFGLLHGLGFAAVLSDYGLPKDNFILTLLSFNLGVEFGQLAVVFSAVLLTLGIIRKTWYQEYLRKLLSLVISGVALVWFIQRL